MKAAFILSVNSLESWDLSLCDTCWFFLTYFKIYVRVYIHFYFKIINYK